MKQFTLFWPTLFLFAFSHSALSQNIVINEVLASNTTSITDENGSHEDWLEIYNYGTSTVNLSGFGLSDASDDLQKWLFPNVSLNAGQYLLVWCSDKNRTIPGSPLHTNFKISASGEAIYLSNASGTAIDSFPATSILADLSYGRLPNGTGAYFFFENPTPGAPNTGTGYSEVLNPPIFSQNSGFFTNGFSLELSSTDSGTTLLYTLDGSEPDAANLGGTTYNYKNQYPELPGQPFGTFLFKNFQTLQYSAPISIVNRTSQPNKISTISTTFDFTPTYFPHNPIFKGTVVRVKAIKSGALSSRTVTKNYFISPQGNNRFTLPVISLSIDENKLYDYEDGICVAGKDFDDWRTSSPAETPDSPIGNYNRKGSEYEREANFSYFVNAQEVINQNIGIRVQGNNSRRYPNKSFNFYSKPEYGKDMLDYKFFSDDDDVSFKRIVVKNLASDFFNSLFRDALCGELAKGLNVVTESYQPAITFLNGEYWGIMAIREKYDDKFFKRVYGIPEDKIELLENDGYNIEEGDNVDYLQMINYFQNNSLVSDTNYNYIKTRMDPESFADHFITNIYLQNTDWPDNNIIFWRRKTTEYLPNEPYGNDGRWRWAIHDMTPTFNGDGDEIWYNSLAEVTAVGPTAPNPEWSTLLLRRLLENNTFKIDFINRFADLMNTSFLPSRVTAQINVMKLQIQPEMTEQMSRWNSPEDFNDWNYFINEAINFANNRAPYQRDHIRQQFAISSNINATLNVSNVSQGYIKMNTINIISGTPGITSNPYPWTGIYFHNIPVKLKAIANSGFVFSHWSGASTSTNAEITLTPTANFSITAHFTPEGPVETSVPIYFWMMDSAIANNLPLETLNSTYELGADGIIQYQSCLVGYPFTSVSPNWRKASMERRNSPTSINYRSEANGNLPYDANVMKGLQIKQPFQSGGLENTMVFNFSTDGYKNIKFSFAAMNELTGVTDIAIDYAVNSGVPTWITTGLASTSLPLTSAFQLFQIDFSSITTVNDNADFKVRLRFIGTNLSADSGNRVTFNNFAVDGVQLPISFGISYTSPNVFVKNTAITNLNPTVSGGTVVSYSVAPSLPTGLSLNTTTGVISGTPTVISSMETYIVTATNSGGNTTANVVITVNDAAPTALSYNSPNVFTKNTTITNLNPTVSGGTVVSYSVAPGLPTGLSLNTVTGVISGTPTVISAMATYVVTATNSGGNTTANVVITVNDAAPTALSYNSPNVYTKNTAITNLNPTVSGGTVISYSVAPSLPTGLSLNTTTGVISGTPTVISAMATYVVTATNSGGSTTANVVITVNDAAPTALSYTSPNVFTKNTAITNLNPTVSGGTVISYSIAPSLPTGLSLNTSTGVISGTPTVISAMATYAVTATNSGGSTTANVVITVNDAAPTALSYNSPNVFTKNTAITNLNPTVSGGTVVSYSVAPSLPTGLSLNTTTGVISGTPTVISSMETYIVTATNSGGNTTANVVITVNDAAPTALSYNSPNVFTKNTAITNLNPTVSGGTVVSYSVAPSLPTGLSLNTTTGVISGTPTVISAMATYVVTATNSGGNTTANVVITVNDAAPTALSYNSPNVFTKNTAITNLNPTVSGGTVVSYSVAPSLPTGLSLNTTTGVISGTPTVISSMETYIVTATNSGGNTTANVVITVNDAAPTALSYNSPNVFTKNTAITNLNPTVSGGTVVSYSVAPSLPTGLSLNTTTGVISGTPTVISAMATYVVTATNSGGNTTANVVITVNDAAPTALSYNSPNIFTKNTAITNLNPSVSGTVVSYSVAPGLPTGLSLNTTTGVISGTPTVISSIATYVVTATNSGGNTTANVVITVNDAAPTALSYNSPNIFTKNTAITNLNPSVSGTVVSYSVAPGLPTGLSLNTTTGVISGTPTVISSMETYIVTATNSGGNTTANVVITVNDAAPTALSYNSPNVFTKNTVIANLNPTVSGGIVVSYSIAPSLPTGLSLNTTTGVISGTPTLISSMETYIVTATNSGGNTTANVVITVNDAAPTALSYTSPNIFTKNTAIVNLNPTVSGGTVVSYSVAPSLPTGLSLNTTTGVISGTPTVISSMETYIVTATNSGGNTTANVVITVNDAAPTALSYNSPNIFTKNTAITNLNPSVSGTVVSYSVAPGLPTGLSLNTTTGVISGTPTVISSIATYVVTAANSGGNTTANVVITVNDAAPTALSYNSPNVFTKNTAITHLNPSVSGTMVSYIVAPSLPTGLSLNTTTGVISGTPTVISSIATYVVTATNSGGNTTANVVITVNDAAPTALSYNSPNVFTKNTVITNLNPTVSGGTVVSYSVAPSLPTGLSLNTTTGVISGTPTVISVMATYIVTATNSGGSINVDVVITVEDPLLVNNNNFDNIIIYPNPFSYIVNIIGVAPGVSYKIFTIDGKLIKKGMFVTSRIELPELPNGVYLLQLTLDDKIKIKKIIKK